jgi:hypothetical protein
MTPEEIEARRKRMEERLATMSPEEKERFQARMREGGRGGFGGGRDASGAGRGASGLAGREGAGRGTGQDPTRARAQGGTPQGGSQNARANAAPTLQSRTMSSGATTIDSLFGPLPVVESRGTVWQYENKQLKAIRLRLGITDQTFTEVLNESDVPSGAELVINMTTGLEQRSQPGQNQQNNPLMGPQRGGGRGGPGGGG